ncbi:hypothetical protein MT325_m305R [Paramecium bursaria chlorella virus MT325]|uniref:Uncharacterized protein m305R n=1 Tax=Paramecium bursaria Chlorella virus MT325 TaxID=346932 RepID=A7IU35_PBCVM|nr:hypothetical protein MT325_m305R [Paramecium bursaria chlorella virus MT325]
MDPLHFLGNLLGPESLFFLLLLDSLQGILDHGVCHLFGQTGFLSIDLLGLQETLLLNHSKCLFSCLGKCLGLLLGFLCHRLGLPCLCCLDCPRLGVSKLLGLGELCHCWLGVW